ncbi:DUF4365 domain-containing protein [Brucepastera parasyntrophica]|uniref:DUF4365 domain-containing protein n=1 Tax=Brucepastera parasyntrophica TaxID=2880008 RepID=UPI00210A79DF|nr:DUF4365 domain-containing protein [Brucepastera parasyntrophica]ULQ61053.1 DUF4365 domain-containing protein [Brucepastera parasyntrophica]
MERPIQHIIDSEAKKIFENSIPSEWVCRFQDSDYGIDYEIEIFEKNKSTGVIFKIQLKGTQNIKKINKNEFVSFSLDIENVDYYLNQIKIPLFIVVVDVSNKDIFWHNPILDNNLKDKYYKADNKKQKTISININTNNQLPKDIGKLQIEYSKIFEVISTKCYFEKTSNTEVLDYINVNQDSITLIQEKADMAKLKMVDELISKGNLDKAVSYLSSINNSNESTIVTKFKSLLLSEHIAIMKWIRHGNLDEDKSTSITNNYVKQMTFLTKNGPEYLRLYSKAVENINNMEIEINKGFFSYVTWKIHEDNSLWKIKLINQRLSLTGRIMEYYNNIKNIISNIMEIKQYQIIPEIFRRFQKAIYGYLIQLYDEKSLILLNSFMADVKKYYEISMKILDVYNIDDFDLITSQMLTFFGFYDGEEYNKYLDYIKSVVKQITDKKVSKRVEDNFNHLSVKYDLTKKNMNNISIDDEIMLHKNIIASLDINLNEQNRTTEIINIGLNDLNPERVLKNCIHLYVKIGRLNELSERLHLPTTGTKILFCTKKLYFAHKSTLDKAYSSLKVKYCDNCLEKESHIKDWKWNRDWQAEQDKLYFSKIGINT